jgi:hypothetical protein
MMERKSETLARIAAKTMDAGREHVARVLQGTETLPEAAGATVEELLSGSKPAPAPKARRTKVQQKAAVRKARPVKTGVRRKKSRAR